MAADIRVILADHHRIVREGLSVLLQRSTPGAPSISITGEADSGLEAIDLCRRLRPDVAVIDAGLGGPSGYEVVRRVAALSLATGAILLSGHVTAQSVGWARQVGASAYVGKDASAAELTQVICRVARGGGSWFPSFESDNALSDRERQVLSHVATGRCNKEIAHALGISAHTVNTHRMRLMRKLEVHDVASLTRIAVELGLTG